MLRAIEKKGKLFTERQEMKKCIFNISLSPLIVSLLRIFFLFFPVKKCNFPSYVRIFVVLAVLSS